ncbi:MAG: RodZ domain-containing protein [Pelobacteraceae bacterium]
MSEELKTPAAKEEVKSEPLKKLPDLKALRESRGLTIMDIFTMTRISVANLEAIENGVFNLLPAPVYTKKFIEGYAKAIGIDAGIILAHYQRHLGETQVVPEEIKVVEVPFTFESKPSKRYLLYVAGVAIVAIAFAMYFFFSEKEPHGTIQKNVTDAKPKEAVPKSPPDVNEHPPEAAPLVPQAPPPATVVQEKTTLTPGNAQLTLLIVATEDTWLSIAEDRNPPSQVTLKTGEKLSRNAQEFFVVNVGNAAGVNITFNGKPLGSLGRKGQVVHLRLPQQ